MSEHLHHRLAVLHQALLHGILPRNLHCTDGLEFIEHLGEVQPTVRGEFAFVVGTKRQFFKRLSAINRAFRRIEYGDIPPGVGLHFR